LAVNFLGAPSFTVPPPLLSNNSTAQFQYKSLYSPFFHANHFSLQPFLYNKSLHIQQSNVHPELMRKKSEGKRSKAATSRRASSAS
jgi:hypothetical protein